MTHCYKVNKGLARSKHILKQANNLLSSKEFFVCFNWDYTYTGTDTWKDSKKLLT